ncbi:MAG TPA: M50 family metallopeptidase, partial [Myxococcaceae bacterium]|nr:M50 family metallopeptidase [Myxococcaceae bacterium]
MKESTPEGEQGSARQPTEEDERLATWLAAAVAAAVGAVFFVHDVAPLDGWHMLSAALVAVCLGMTRATLVIYLATVLIHELGHAAFGLAFGLALHSIRVGPWTISRSAGAWQLRFDGKASLSGETVFLPRALSRRGRWWTSAGGPMANLVTGAAAGVFGWTVGLRPLRAALGILAVASLVGVGNLLPLELPSGGRTDGAVMLALGRVQPSPRPSELLELGRLGRRPSSKAARELYRLGSAGQRLSSGTVTPAAAHAA